jgi:hypothetical protein
VITNGSVQAPERLYWFAAQTLAKARYVVLTFDPQGKGLSPDDGTTDVGSCPAKPKASRTASTTGATRSVASSARAAEGREPRERLCDKGVDRTARRRREPP